MNRKDKETLMDAEPVDASGRTRADRAEDLTHADSEPEIGIYRERAHLVAHLAALHPSHIGHTDPDEPDWAVLIVETPEGQMSWHIAPDDMDLFGHVRRTDRICRGWDGHTTPEKYRRLRALTVAPRASQAATATNGPGDEAGAAHDPHGGSAGHTEARQCDGSDDPRKRCGHHHTTDVGNAMGGYNCCCGWAWLGRTNECSTGAKTGAPVPLCDRVSDLLSYVASTSGSDDYDAQADAVIPAIRAAIADEIEAAVPVCTVMSSSQVVHRAQGMNEAAHIARGDQ